MRKKSLRLFAMLIIGVFALFMLIGCVDPNEHDDETNHHEHSYGTWQHNAQEHWKECECGERSEQGQHSENNSQDYSEGLQFELVDNEYSVVGYNGSDRDVIIPNEYNGLPVTSIGDFAFVDAELLELLELMTYSPSFDEEELEKVVLNIATKGIKSVFIPSSVKSIGEMAFWYNMGLQSVVFGDDSQLSTIGYGAFGSCFLTNITIPAEVVEISENAFAECPKLVEVYNLSSLDITKGSMEHGEIGLIAENIYTPTEGESKICIDNDGYVTYQDGEDKILIAYNPQNNDCSVCGYMQENNIDLPSDINKIGDWAFAFNANLTILSLQDNVTSIGEWAFGGCISLTIVEIPNSVTSICEGAFEECNSLSSITIPFTGADLNESGITHFGWIFGASAYESEEYRNKEYVPESLKTVVINGGSIDNKAFYNCTSLTNVTFGSGVDSIDSRAFAGCSNLMSVTISDSVTSIEDYAFEGCYKIAEIYNLSSLDIIKGSGDYGSVASNALDVYTSLSEPSKLSTDSDGYVIHTNGAEKALINYRSGLTHLILPEGITDVLTHTLYDDEKLVSVVLPSSLTTIDFIFPETLISVTIGENVTSISDYVFSNCRLVEVYNLSSLDITKGSRDHGGVASNALDVYTSLSEPSKISVDSEGYVVRTDGEQKTLIGYIGNETKLIIPEGITDLNSCAFYKWGFFEGETSSITLPSTVTSLTFGAFFNCWVNQLIIPTSLTSTAEYDDFRDLRNVFYCGTEEQWNENSLSFNPSPSNIANGTMQPPTVYFYSETEPIDYGNYWHYDIDGVTPVEWFY